MVASLFRSHRAVPSEPAAPRVGRDILQAIGLADLQHRAGGVVCQCHAGEAQRQGLRGLLGRSRAAVAQMAMLVAEERVSVCNIFPDQAYLAGIFHDCGVPVLMQRFTTYCKACI